MWEGATRITQSAQVYAVADEGGTCVQPSLVVEEVRLSVLQAQGLLVVQGGGLECGKVWAHERAPPGEGVEAQPDGQAPVARGEDLGGVSVSSAEVGRPRLGEHVDDFTGPLVQQVGVDAASVAEQAVSSAVGGPGAGQQHQARGVGKAGALRVRREFAVAKSCVAGSACLARDTPDGGQSVGVAVAVGGDGHDARGEGQRLVTCDELVEGDEAVLAQPLDDLGRGTRGLVIEVVRCKKIAGAHRRTPSSAVGRTTVQSGGRAGKATDCRLRQIT